MGLAVNLNHLQCAGVSVSFRGETGGFWGLHPRCSPWFLLSRLLGRHDFKPRAIWGFVLQREALSCGSSGALRADNGARYALNGDSEEARMEQGAVALKETRERAALPRFPRRKHHLVHVLWHFCIDLRVFSGSPKLAGGKHSPPHGDIRVTQAKLAPSVAKVPSTR